MVSKSIPFVAIARWLQKEVVDDICKNTPARASIRNEGTGNSGTLFIEADLSDELKAALSRIARKRIYRYAFKFQKKK